MIAEGDEKEMPFGVSRGFARICRLYKSSESMQYYWHH
jgi:hypothetical protein